MRRTIEYIGVLLAALFLAVAGSVAVFAEQTNALGVERVDGSLNSTMSGYWNMQIRFDRDIDLPDGTVNVEQDPSVRNCIEINGFTLGEIWDGGKDAEGEKVVQPLMVHRLPNGDDPRVVLHIFVSAEITPETGGIRTDGTQNTLSVLPGFTAVTGETVQERVDFINKGAGWAKVIDTSGVVWGEIRVLSVAAPKIDVLDNVSFLVTFDQPLSNKQLLHINASSDWLLAVSKQQNPPFVYTAEELQLMQSYGIIDSISEKIYFNGKSIAELMRKEEDPAQRPGTVMVHIGGTGDMNVMEISFGGRKVINGETVDGVNRIDNIDQEFVLEFKQGLKTVTSLETKEDYVFRYSPASGKFSRVIEGQQSSETGMEAVYYNGYAIAEGGKIPLRGGAFDESLLTVVTVDEAAFASVTSGKDGITVRVTATDGTYRDYYYAFETPEKGGSAVVWICVGVAAAVIAAGVCAFIILYRRKKK